MKPFFIFATSYFAIYLYLLQKCVKIFTYWCAFVCYIEIIYPEYRVKGKIHLKSKFFWRNFGGNRTRDDCVICLAGLWSIWCVIWSEWLHSPQRPTCMLETWPSSGLQICSGVLRLLSCCWRWETLWSISRKRPDFTVDIPKIDG